jgi:hypothetical protein
MTSPAHTKDFSTLHSYIKTQLNENRWTTIPWELDLFEARKKAVQEKKPIFIWAMNGHPLGCT